MRVAAIVAAAGGSSRLGRPKALLPWDPAQTFLERTLRVLDAAGVHDVAVTLPAQQPGADFLRALSRVESAGTRRVDTNRYPAQGLTGSVRTALELFPDDDALLVWPIDCPFADAGLVRTLADCARRGVVAAVPVVDGVRGHPVAFSRATFELLADADRMGGPRGVLAALGDEVLEVPHDDPRVAYDVDTVEDYTNLFGRKP
jgi:molybdenum cofactor cytidylyltransferase